MGSNPIHRGDPCGRSMVKGNRSNRTRAAVNPFATCAMTDSNFDKAALYRNGILVLLLVFVVLIVHEIFGANGLLALRQQQKERQDLQQRIHQLQQENEQLEKQVKELKSN